MECWPAFLFQKSWYITCTERKYLVTEIMGPCHMDWDFSAEIIFKNLSSVYCLLTWKSQGLSLHYGIIKSTPCKTASPLKTGCKFRSRTSVPSVQSSPCHPPRPWTGREKKAETVLSPLIICLLTGPNQTQISKRMAKTGIQHLCPPSEHKGRMITVSTGIWIFHSLWELFCTR